MLKGYLWLLREKRDLMPNELKEEKSRVLLARKIGLKTHSLASKVMFASRWASRTHNINQIN